MKNKIRSLLVTALLAIYVLTPAQQKFYIDLKNNTGHLFNVVLVPEQLSNQNRIYQFASTAPGTYETMDIGRFVRSFKAFDASGRELETKQASVNQWELSDPVHTAKIEYSVADTWNTPVDKNPVMAMCGTTIEKDNILINGQCVFGYFEGMQKKPIKIKLEYPADWSVGTALKLDSNGFYDAPNYDYVVDSPILLGNLTLSTTKIENTTIDVYSYSKTGKINAEQVAGLLDDILSATSQFTKGLPVEHYTFLFHFENFSVGAWEHNLSSEYIFNEAPLEDNFARELKSIAAHEFYHIITPLNIHSELVGNFNYAKPVMSQHIWLYEGVTEWASRLLQLRDNIMTLDEFLADTKSKLIMNGNFNQSVSLVDLSLHSTEMMDQYPNIYQKGALVACLLDIRLLELSKGTRGLREVLNELYKTYGSNKAFDEKGFFDEFTKRTYPEIADFINRYIKGTDKLPVEEYFGKLGIEYKESMGVDSSKVSLGFGIGFKDNGFVVISVGNQSSGLMIADKLVKLNGEEITMGNIQAKSEFIKTLKVGDQVTFTIERNGVQKEVSIKMEPRPIRHQFRVVADPTPGQSALRNAWMKNL
jgi:predicted metalloprotease with PDZ domain